MKHCISKSKISGYITAPSSKSSLQRHIVAAMLASGQSTIQFESLGEDVSNLLKIAKELTNSTKIKGNTIIINGGISSKFNKIDVGESGLALRMLSPIFCVIDNDYEIHGQGSLLNRPIDFIIDSLQQIGVDVQSDKGKLPLILKGRIKKNCFIVDGALSSQLLTGYLMAAPLLNKNVEILVTDLKSKPYVDLTISVLKEYGVDVSNQNYSRFLIKSGQKYKAKDTIVEGDWSSVAFLLVASAISGKITVSKITAESKQGDRKILDVLRQVGANVVISNNQITVIKNKLNEFEFDATDTPDLFPPLVALAVNCNGTSKIQGVNRLFHKESNRAETLKSEFEKLSASIEINGDFMIIKGGKLKANTVKSHNDHRIAMALAVAALTIDGKVVVEQSESVAKSWPNFFADIKTVGANVIP